MSTLKVTNIQATGETVGRAVSGVAAAWVNFNGTGTIASRDSSGISSLTDNGGGDYTINFTNSFDNTGYCLVGSCAYVSGTGQPSAGHNLNTTTKDVSHDDIYTVYQQSVVDPTFVELAFLGDLA
jgi:hypothetical protein